MKRLVECRKLSSSDSKGRGNLSPSTTGGWRSLFHRSVPFLYLAGKLFPAADMFEKSENIFRNANAVFQPNNEVRARHFLSLDLITAF